MAKDFANAVDSANLLGEKGFSSCFSACVVKMGNIYLHILQTTLAVFLPLLSKLEILRIVFSPVSYTHLTLPTILLM